MQETRKGEGLSPFTVLKALRRRKFYFLIPVVFLTIACAVLATRLPRRYRAQTLIAANSTAPRDYLNRSEAVIANVQDQMSKIRETLYSAAVLGAVIREFDLADRRLTDAQAMEALKPKVTVQIDAPDTFYIRFEGKDSNQVVLVANRLAELFIEQTSDNRGQQVREAGTVLDAEVERLHQQLKEKEANLKSYQASASHELPAYLATNLKLFEGVQTQMQSLSEKISEEQARRSAALTEMKELEKEGALEKREAPPQPLTAAETNLETLRLKLKGLRSRGYTGRHPEVINTEKEIQELEKAGVGKRAVSRSDPSAMRMRYLTLQAELESIDQRVRGYQKERNDLASRVSVYESRLHSAPQRERDQIDRMKEVEFTRSQYENLLKKRQELALDERFEKSKKRTLFRIVEAAASASPSGPQPLRVMLMGFAASLGLGLFLVLAVEHLDSSFDTIEGFQGFTNLPVLGVVPSVPGRALPGSPAGNGRGRSNGNLSIVGNNGFSPGQIKHFRKHRLVTLSDPGSVPSEQYGILALKMKQWMEQHNGRLLAMTSSAGGEGKSMSAVNLSLALSSLIEEPVLLVDADLRRPRVHEYLGLEPSLGFSQLLQGTGDIEKSLMKVEGLHVIPGGPVPRDPVGLLSSRRANEIFASLRERFRLVVLDSPPIMPIADSHILASVADGVLMVVRARCTRRELFRRAIDNLDAGNVLGVLMNDVEFRDTRYAYVYKYYQKHYLGH